MVKEGEGKSMGMSADSSMLTLNVYSAGQTSFALFKERREGGRFNFDKQEFKGSSGKFTYLYSVPHTVVIIYVYSKQ